MTTTYYIPPENITGNQVIFPDEEAHHAVQVLRHQVGDEVTGVDGCGGSYRILLQQVSKKQVTGEIVETKIDEGESEVKVTIALGVLKNQKRFEVFVEKACELGVVRIIPLQTLRTEKPSIRKERFQKILIAAMKQCGRSRLVDVTDLMSLKALVKAAGSAARFICHEKAGEEDNFLHKLQGVMGNRQKDVLIAIGPEGGFSEEEVQLAETAGFQVVSLGKRRLRAETAAITACAGIMLSFDVQK